MKKRKRKNAAREYQGFEVMGIPAYPFSFRIAALIHKIFHGSPKPIELEDKEESSKSEK